MFDIGDHTDAVADRIREIGTVEVLQRFRQLRTGDIEEKSPGDLVTIADRECERVLGAALADLRPVPVVGEEATEADPGLLQAIEREPAVWLVDPVDGTANFVAGSEDFAVMVAYIADGQIAGAWVWLPTSDRMVVAVRGGGVTNNGHRLVMPERAQSDGGVLKVRYVPPPHRAAFDEVATTVVRHDDRRCAGVEYLDLVDGETSFLAYWRTKPWDHAPGALIASEAGLRVGRFDESEYRPGDDRRGLLTARPDRFADLASRLHHAQTL